MVFNEMPRCLITVENNHEASRNIWRCNISTVCRQTCMRWNGTRDLQKNQAKRLIDESPEPLKSVVKFALVTVLRKSNIINLEWQQIDMQRQVARVNPEDSKSNRAIGVALNDTASKVLHDQTGKHHKCGCTYQGG